MHRNDHLNSIYWISYSVATVYALNITTMYWIVVHDPGKSILIVSNDLLIKWFLSPPRSLFSKAIYPANALNLLSHAGNLILMLLDLLIVRHQIKITHLYFTVGLFFMYSALSWIYFLMGLTNLQNEPYVYKFMDWRTPGTTILILVGIAVGIFLVHMLLVGLSQLRQRLCNKFLKIHCMRSNCQNFNLIELGCNVKL